MRDAIELAALGWVAAVLSAETVIFAEQLKSAPRPTNPYTTVQLVRDNALSATSHFKTTQALSGSEFVREKSKARSILIRVDCYGEAAFERIRTLEDSKNDYPIQQLLDSLGISVQRPLSVVPVTQIRDNRFEIRVQADFPGLYTEVRTDAEQAIEQYQYSLGVAGMAALWQLDGTQLDIAMFG